MKWRMKKMLKKIGLPVIALLGMLAMAPHPAKAAVRFGIVVGRPYPVYAVCPRVAVAPVPVVVAGPWVGPAVRWDLRHDFRVRR
jgi:hypothetical protein